jgi:hypothetical protein
MLPCLLNYIGLSYCESGVYETPDSGIFLNTLPGMSIESIDKIATPEQITYLKVWNDVQLSAIPDFRSDVIAEIMRCYAIDCECDYDKMICDNINLLTQSFKYKLAIWLLIYRINTNRVNRYTTIDLQSAKDLRTFYETEYRKSLSQEVMCIDVSDCKLCCGGNPQIVSWLP